MFFAEDSFPRLQHFGLKLLRFRQTAKTMQGPRKAGRSGYSVRVILPEDSFLRVQNFTCISGRPLMAAREALPGA